MDCLQAGMFKIPLPLPPRQRPVPRRARWLLACLAVLFLAATGCRTVPPLPAIDLLSSDWKVRQGQAVWQNNRHAPELAGELLIASRPGHVLVQFTKPPFTILAAQQTEASWEVRIPLRNQRYSGPGPAPKRIAWLHLPGLLEGGSAPRPWIWSFRSDGTWRLSNPRSGEFIEGYLLE